MGPSASSAAVFWSISSAALSRSAGSDSGGTLPTDPSRRAVSRSIAWVCASCRARRSWAVPRSGSCSVSSWTARSASFSRSSCSSCDRPRSRRAIWSSRSCFDRRKSNAARRLRTAYEDRNRPSASEPMTAAMASGVTRLPVVIARAVPATAPTEKSIARAAQRCHVGSGTWSWKSTSTASPRLAFSAAMSRSRTRRRSTSCRMTDTGCGDGFVASRCVISSLRTTACRNRSYRSAAASRSASDRSAWRALSSMARTSARAASASRRRSRATASASRSRSSSTSSASPFSTDAAVRATASVATLRRPGLRSPRIWRSRRARSSFFFATDVPRSAPLMDACRRSRSAASSRASSSSSWWRTDAVDRKNGSVGMPVSSASSSSARAGSVVTSPSTSSRTVPRAPRNAFSR